MKRQIKIQDVIFSDGIIEKCELTNQELRVFFKDYSDSELILCFRGNLKLKIQEGIGLSVYESHLEETDQRTKLSLLGDDLEELLTVEFDWYKIDKAE